MGARSIFFRSRVVGGRLPFAAVGSAACAGSRSPASSSWHLWPRGSRTRIGRRPTRSRCRSPRVVDLPAKCARVRVSTETKKPKWGSVSFRPGPKVCKQFASNGVTVVQKSHRPLALHHSRQQLRLLEPLHAGPAERRRRPRRSAAADRGYFGGRDAAWSAPASTHSASPAIVGCPLRRDIDRRLHRPAGEVEGANALLAQRLLGLLARRAARSGPRPARRRPCSQRP